MSSIGRKASNYSQTQTASAPSSLNFRWVHETPASTKTWGSLSWNSAKPVTSMRSGASQCDSQPQSTHKSRGIIYIVFRETLAMCCTVYSVGIWYRYTRWSWIDPLKSSQSHARNLRSSCQARNFGRCWQTAPAWMPLGIVPRVNSTWNHRT